MYYFNANGSASKGWLGKSEYVWGEFFEHEGGRNGPMGLPLTDVSSLALSVLFDWWYQWFERGFIYRAQDSITKAVYTLAWNYSSNVLDENGT